MKNEQLLNLQRNHAIPQDPTCPFYNNFIRFSKSCFSLKEGLISPKRVFSKSFQTLENYQNIAKLSNFLVQNSDSLKKPKSVLMGIFVDIQAQAPPQLLLWIPSSNCETINFTLSDIIWLQSCQIYSMRKKSDGSKILRDAKKFELLQCWRSLFSLTRALTSYSKVSSQFRYLLTSLRIASLFNSFTASHYWYSEISDKLNQNWTFSKSKPFEIPKNVGFLLENLDSPQYP